MDPGSFSPTSDWVTNYLSSGRETPQRIVTPDGANNGANTSEISSCGCSRPPTTERPEATISTIPMSLTLICEVPAPYDAISWWRYQCSASNSSQHRVQIASGVDILVRGYIARIGITRKGYFSSLTIQDITSASGSGLYQCVSHTSGNSSALPFFSKTDYFVIGKRESQQCLFEPVPKSRLNLERILDSGEFREGRNQGFQKSLDERQSEVKMTGDEGMTRLVFDFSDAIEPFQAENFEVKTDLVPPPQQRLGEIPIQNSSYIRFDFTNGEKVLNRNLP